MINHRGFDPEPSSISTICLDASLTSDLRWDIDTDADNILWELDFQIKNLSPISLSSYQLGVRVFAEKIWEKHRDNTLGVILYKGKVPPFPMEDFAEYLHHIGAMLPDETPPFALFDCAGDPTLFSKEIFPYIHLGFRSGPIGIIKWEESLKPRRFDARVGVALPLRGKEMGSVKKYLSDLDAKGTPYRLIAEPYITEEWDDLDTLVIFPELISSWGMRMVQGFEAAGGTVLKISG